MSQQPKASTSTRRSFLKRSSILVAGSAVGGSLTIAQAAHPFGTDTIKVGLVGCGGRGTGAAIQIQSRNWPDCVVWNPWQTMEGCYREFCCVENAVADSPVVLSPGEKWVASAEFTVVNLS